MPEPGENTTPVNSTPTNAAGSAGTPNDGKVRLIVDGKEHFVTQEELVTRAQKGMHAESETQKAVEARRQAEAALAIVEDARAAARGDADAYRRFGSAIGLSDDYVKSQVDEFRRREIASVIDSHQTPQDTPDDDQQADAGPVDVKQIAAQVASMLMPVISKAMGKQVVTAEQLDPRLRKAVSTVYGGHLEQQIMDLFAQDDYFSKLKKFGSEEQRRAVHSEIVSEARSRAAAGNDMSDPDQVSAMLADVKKRYQALGIRPAATSTPFGLGSASGGTAPIYDVQNATRPKNGMLDEDGWLDYFSQRVRQELLNHHTS